MGSFSLLWRATFWLLVQGLQSMWISARVKNRTCFSYGSGALEEGVEHLRGLVLEDGQNGTIECPHNQCCFGIWNLIQGQLQAQLKGCWISEKEAACDSPTCESRSDEDSLTLSCSCRADLCNDNIRHDRRRHADSLRGSTETIWIISTCLVLFFLGFLVFLGTVPSRRALAWNDKVWPHNGKPECVCVTSTPMLLPVHCKILEGTYGLRLWKGPVLPIKPEESGELSKITTGHEKCKRKLPRQELPDLQFHKVLHEGQYSKVWQGAFRQQPVAIKSFPHSCYREFASEWAVHSLPLMNHDNVVQLVAAGCGGPDIEQGGLLVLTLYPLGSLRHFLTQHVCSWDVAIRLGSSLAKGLAFLHGEQWKEGLHKPGVAHRDLSSQNVLVQEDQTCVISDFGLAMTLPKCHEWWRESPTEGVIRKAGAPRYTAPEILDESLNLQDLGSALRQADVYSMALVLWETLMRCSVLFPENSIPEFQLAYEAELGSNPTYSELRRLAVKERLRPAIPPAWRRMGQVSVYLQELLEDCWDPEPEARLQAECARQRLQWLGAADGAKECC